MVSLAKDEQKPSSLLRPLIFSASICADEMCYISKGADKALCHTGGKQGGICGCLNEGFQSPQSSGDGGGAVCNLWKEFGGSSPSHGGAGQTLSRWMC